MFVSTNVLGYVSWVREVKAMGNSKLLQFGIGIPKNVKMDRVPFAKRTGNSEWGTVYQNVSVKMWSAGNDSSLENFAKRIRKGITVAIKDAEISFDMRTGDPELYKSGDGVTKAKLELLVPSIRNIDILPSVGASNTQSAPQTQQKPVTESKVDYDFDYDIDENDLF